VNEAAESRVAHAVISVFDVTGDALLEGLVAFNADDQIVPTEAAMQRPVFPEVLTRAQTPLIGFVGVDVEDHHIDRCPTAIGKDEGNAAFVAEIRFVTRVDIEIGRGGREAALESAEEAIRPVDL